MNWRRRHERAPSRAHRALRRRHPHQSLDRCDQLRAAGIVRAGLVSSALFWLTNLFGGGPWTRSCTPSSAASWWPPFPVGSEILRENLLQRRDWIWLRNINEVVHNREENLPEVGRYNGGQKLLFFTIVLCLTCLLLSGVVIWRQYFSAYFAIDVVRLGGLAHAFFGFVLICSIVVHIYAGIWVKARFAP